VKKEQKLSRPSGRIGATSNALSEEEEKEEEEEQEQDKGGERRTTTRSGKRLRNNVTVEIEGRWTPGKRGHPCD